MKRPYSVGEFSTITGLSVKTLRFYHEKGILLPTSVDEATGYRYYDEAKIEKARVIMRFRALEFSIEDITAMLHGCDDEADILNYLERQKKVLQQQIRKDRDVLRSLNEIITREVEAKQILARDKFLVQEKSLAPLLVAGIRLKGRYDQCGVVFARLGRAVGRYLCGKPLCLYYDGEYLEDDADFEPCFPVRKQLDADGVSVRTLPGARCLALVHRGRYDQLGRSYAKILEHAKSQKLKVDLPTREIYIKGPGMILKGNPRNYLTEIQLPLAA